MSNISFVSTAVEQVDFGAGGLHSASDVDAGIKETSLHPTEEVKPLAKGAGKSLYEQLQEQKEASEAAMKAKYGPLHKPPRALDEEDVRFLDEHEKKRREKEALDKKVAEQDLAAYELALSTKVTPPSSTVTTSGVKRQLPKPATENAPKSALQALSQKLSRGPAAAAVKAEVTVVAPIESEIEAPQAKKAKMTSLVEYDSDDSS